MSNLVATKVTANTWLNKDGSENFKVRAWADIDVSAGVPTVRAGGNVSSIADLGVGAYRANYIKALPSSNYAFFANASDTDNNGDTYTAIDNNVGLRKVDSVTFYVAGGQGRFDPAVLSIMSVGG